MGNNYSDKLVSLALVPGLPHILKPDLSPHYRSLADGISSLGDQLFERGVKRVLYYSTQWISVLGHLFQAREDCRGLHVDENWYDIIDLPFAMKIDRPFAQAMAKAMGAADYQTKLVDYEGFPVDTGTIVCDTLLNKGRFKTNMLSCNVYSDGKDTEKLAGIIRAQIDGSQEKTAAIAISGLSQRFFTTEIDFREDHVRSKEDDEWNQRILKLWKQGQYAEAAKLYPEYCKEAKVDMGMKAMNFLTGMAGAKGLHAATTVAYGAIYGTGAAVLEF
jgi:2-aminophenol/2-amino-5-chlorophenol 1,6-dioxygenase subunit alpha